MKWIKDNWFKVVIAIPCLAISIYFTILIVKQVHPPKPLTYAEQKMHCLELGSNLRTKNCLQLINGQ